MAPTLRRRSLLAGLAATAALGTGSLAAPDPHARVAPTVVYPDGSTWVAEAPDGSTLASGSDPGAVINSALTQSTAVHVVGTQSRTRLTTATTIDHTRAHTALTLAPGTVLDYRGTGAAVRFGGGHNGLWFAFDEIDANGAPVGVRSTGHGTSRVVGNTIVNAATAAWVEDGPNGFGGVSNSLVQVQWLNCAGATTTDVGLDMIPGMDCQGHHYEFGVVYGPAETGIRIGRRAGAESYRYTSLRADVDADPHPADTLVETYCGYTGVVLDGYIRASGDHDLRFGPQASGSTVVCRTEDPERPVRVARETPHVRVDHVGDPLNVSMQVTPASLDGWFEGHSGTGSASLATLAGGLDLATGADAYSWGQAVRATGDPRVSFDNPIAGRVTLSLPDVSDCRAWCSTGDRQTAPGIGVVVDGGTLYGRAADGSAKSRVSLAALADGQQVTADYLFVPGDRAVFWVDGTHAGTVTTALPSGTPTTAHRIMQADVSNLTDADRHLRVHDWRVRQWPT